jgi:hypothetical protein
MRLAHFMVMRLKIGFTGLLMKTHIHDVRRGVGKSLAFPICSTNKIIFLRWVKEVRTTKA